MSWIDAAIVLAFAAFAVAVGLSGRRRASSGLDEYFLAGRSLRGWQAGLSMAATQFAADTPLLATGLIATAGIFSLWRLWVYALAFLLLGFVLAPCWRRARVLTDAALAERRYAGRAGTWLRALKAVYFGGVFNCTVLAMVLFAAKEIAEPFLVWDQWLPAQVFEGVRRGVEALGVPFASARADGDLWLRTANNALSLAALLAITALYSTTGGLRSVVRTDLGQLGVMLAATALYALWAVAEVGGWAAVGERLAGGFDGTGPTGLTRDQLLAFTPDHARDATLAVLGVLGLQWLVQMNADGTGYLAQRSMACRSDRDARQASVVFAFAQVGLRSLLWIPLGLALLVLFPPAAELSGDALRADREASYVSGMAGLPPGLLGLLLTAMLAALASTIDSHLNWGASYWTHDLYARFVSRDPAPRTLVRVARLSGGLVLAAALGIMTQLGSIQAAWHLSLLLGAGMGAMLVLRWLWWRISAAGELAALAASAALAPVLLWGPLAQSEALRLLVMACAATGAGVAASLLWPEPRRHLAEFYRQVRPPGFWGPIAAAAGDTPASGRGALFRGLASTAACAVTLFAWLVALGSWLVDAPAPLGAPPGAWIGGLGVLGAAAVPVWWRALRE